MTKKKETWVSLDLPMDLAEEVGSAFIDMKVNVRQQDSASLLSAAADRLSSAWEFTADEIARVIKMNTHLAPLPI